MNKNKRERVAEEGVGGGGRFIRLSNPAICSKCGRLLPKQRGAFWDAGIVTCVPCVRKHRGTVPMDSEEEMLLAEEIDEREGKG